MMKFEIWLQPEIPANSKKIKYNPTDCGDLGHVVKLAFIGKVVNRIRNRFGSGRLRRIMITDIPKPKWLNR